MQTMMPATGSRARNADISGKNTMDRQYLDDVKSQTSKKSANTYQRSNFRMGGESDAGELKIENDRL